MTEHYRRSSMAPSASSVDIDRCTVRVQQLGGCFITRLTGQVDARNASALWKHLCGLVDLGPVAIDLSAVTSLDPAAAAAMLAVHRRAHQSGTSLQLAAAQGAVRSSLETTHLLPQLTHHDDIADAVEAALTTGTGTGSNPRTLR